MNPELVNIRSNTLVPLVGKTLIFVKSKQSQKSNNSEAWILSLDVGTHLPLKEHSGHLMKLKLKSPQTRILRADLLYSFTHGCNFSRQSLKNSFSRSQLGGLYTFDMRISFFSNKTPTVSRLELEYSNTLVLLKVIFTYVITPPWLLFCLSLYGSLYVESIL